MELDEALKVLLIDESIGDFIYTIRDRVASDPAFPGETWEHPRVKAFSDAVEKLRELRDSAPVSDEDLVMRFRKLASELEPRLPDESERERRSRIVTMLLRAAVESLVAHIGPNPVKVSYVVGEETKLAIAQRIAQVKGVKH